MREAASSRACERIESRASVDVARKLAARASRDGTRPACSRAGERMQYRQCCVSNWISGSSIVTHKLVQETTGGSVGTGVVVDVLDEGLLSPGRLVVEGCGSVGGEELGTRTQASVCVPLLTSNGEMGRTFSVGYPFTPNREATGRLSALSAST